jgi:hypothetical protein
MSSINQTRKEIREAYLFLRKENQTVPSETLQFMLDASMEKLSEIEKIQSLETDYEYEL